MPGAWARRGRAFGWKWDSVSDGKAGPGRTLWPPFQFRRCPPPRAEGSAALRANERHLANLELEHAPDPNCRNCGGGGGGRDPSSLFPPSCPTDLRDRHCSLQLGGAPRRRELCQFAPRQEGGGLGGWGGFPGVPSASSRVSPPTRPSQFFFLAPSPGWLDRRGLAPDLRGAPPVFNDSLKVAVGKVERDEADVGRVLLLCKSRKGSWEPCGWPQAPAPRPQQVGGGVAAAGSPIPLPSLARCALAAGAERVRGPAVPPPPYSLTCLLRSAPGGPRHGLLEAASAAHRVLPPPGTPGSGGQ